ncbi:MAG: glutamine--fructose-6-phosphate transaminase (isomerizing) [Cellvibrionaceae bacterium]|nr:glutamine--fructose-6-phosphate transaminase (isomerizing) [Cellvibrionaceae bacterium]
MCGIVGGVTQRNVLGILVEGLKRLEYRGYDSAGVALVEPDGELSVRKALGKVSELEKELAADPTRGNLGIAHTRWATHGKPSQSNAHPHHSDHIAIVHNGIIENHETLRSQLMAMGYEFNSETDTEVIAHLLHHNYKAEQDIFKSLQATVSQLEGAYGIAVISSHEPERLVAARSGSPLVLGIGIEENFLASDTMALRQVTDRFVYLEEGDMVDVHRETYSILDKSGAAVERDITRIAEVDEVVDKGHYRHFMQKEIFEQARVIRHTLQGRVGQNRVLEQVFGIKAPDIFDKVQRVQIIACGTSYHSGLVCKYWLEDWAGIPCDIEVASEYRYRKVVVSPGTLFVTISQSGETADTLAALRLAKELDYLASLTICNVPNSSLARESDLVFMTNAGPEIGVASTKAFTTQLVSLQLLTIVLGRRSGITEAKEKEMVQALHTLPKLCEEVLALDPDVLEMSEHFSEKHHALFLGRGPQYPVAMEGALKLKEISYIHAESYPAGELKHGPLALVDADMPVVAVAPNNELLEKLKSNLEEVQARGGVLYVFADKAAGFSNNGATKVINLPHVPTSLEPIIYTIPLQLLSYHVAVLKGTDVDQPRNLAKSVTVE